jgi:hypothetical protein
MGINKSFDSRQADFTGISSSDRLFISEVNFFSYLSGRFMNKIQNLITFLYKGTAVFIHRCERERHRGSCGHGCKNDEAFDCTHVRSHPKQTVLVFHNRKINRPGFVLGLLSS